MNSDLFPPNLNLVFVFSLVQNNAWKCKILGLLVDLRVQRAFVIVIFSGIRISLKKKRKAQSPVSSSAIDKGLVCCFHAGLMSPPPPFSPSLVPGFDVAVNQAPCTVGLKSIAL